MERYQNINAVIHKTGPDVEKSFFLEDLAIPLHVSNQIDLGGTLELLNTTNDINLQTRLFSVLSASLLLNNNLNVEVIIRYRAVYDRINNVLAKGLPRKAVHALNFLSTLFYVDAEDDGPTKRRTLALYAKNMTRSSGCLATMSDMFTNCMMYHDTWNALCQCLAAACDGSALNQSYCTHLIPVCIQRCNQTNMEIFLILQSLLLNHDKNMELFLKCNGISMFTRELMHYDKCLLLLITMVQCPAASSLLLRQGQVLNDLRDFLRLYGSTSQIGQKAMIILNHIKLLSRETNPQNNRSRRENILNILKPQERANTNEQMQEHNEMKNVNDTATLMQNVMKEVFKFKQHQLASLKKPASKADVKSIIRSTSTMIINPDGQRNNTELHITNTSTETKKNIDQRRRDRQYNNNADLTFSFLRNLDSNHSNIGHIISQDTSKIFHDKRFQTAKEVTKTKTFDENDENSSPYVYRTISKEKSASLDPKDFRPIFSSTPKHEDISNLIDFSKTSTRKSNFPGQSPTMLQSERTIVKRRPNRMLRKNDKNLRNISFSSRFFSAINESCTTLVKSVANIFKKNEPTGYSKDRIETNASRAKDNSFSFLKYMQKRDAVMNKLLKTRNKDCSAYSFETESCETCDTQALKRKMARNEHLKQTVKKLKTGINLYGCDFKKISRTMWPRDSYMTPIVLYNLYRKLLLK